MPAKPEPIEIVEAAEARRYEDFILDAYQTRREYLMDYVARLEKLDAFLDGDWAVEFPDGRVIRDKPKIENGVLTKIEDTGTLAGNTIPTIRVTPRNERDYNPAQEREQIIYNYWNDSQVPLLLPRWYMDLLGTGLAAVKVWPDFKQKDRTKRFPKYKRIDPRHMLPPLDYVIDGNTAPHDIIIHRYVKTRSLIHQYPEQIGELARVAARIAQSSNRGKRRDQHIAVDISQVLLVEYWGVDAIIYCAMVDGHPETMVTLMNEYNVTECSPVALAIRPTANGKIRGKVDSMMPILAAENRLVTYILDYADQLVFAPLKKKGTVQNAEEFGPGAIIDLGMDGDIARVEPARADPQLFAIIADLNQNARGAGNQPAARQGQSPTSSIGSGNMVESLMGGLTTEVQSLQKTVEVMLMQANASAMEQDIAYCDEAKEISGEGPNGGYRLKYRPSSDLKGRTDNFVTYGAGAGLDKFNAEIRLDQRARGGYVPKRWVREQMDGIGNIAQIEQGLYEEAALAAFMQGMLAKAAQGDLTAVAAFQMVLRQKKNPLLALEMMGEEALKAQAEAPAQQPGPAPMPETAQGEAAALKGGALPGTQEGLPAGGVGATPPVSNMVM